MARVRTPAGSEKFGQPIGSVIQKDAPTPTKTAKANGWIGVDEMRAKLTSREEAAPSIKVHPNYTYPDADRRGKYVVIVYTKGKTTTTIVATEARARELASKPGVRSATILTPRPKKTVTAAAGDSWKWQLRDRLGKWIEMGSEVKWLANGLSRLGTVVDSPSEGVATVDEHKTHRRLDIPSNRLTVVDAKTGKRPVEKPAVPVAQAPEAPAPNAPAPAAPAATPATPKVSREAKGTVNPTAATPEAGTPERAAPAATDPTNQGFFDKVWNLIQNFRNPDGSRRPGRPEGDGSETDPIFVGNDVNKAVELIMAGKHIRMSDENVVPTVVAKLGPEIKKAQNRVDAMPDGPEKTAAKNALAINLCAIHVPGSNLFCITHKGVPRVLMPQLSGRSKDGKDMDVQAQAVEMLEKMGLIGANKKVDPSSVRASQNELGAAQIDGMVNNYMHWLTVQQEIDALPAGDPKRAELEAERTANKQNYMPESVLTNTILTTTDKYIIDGHHRWAAMILANIKREEMGLPPLKMDVREVDMEVGEALATVNAFASAAGIVPKAASGAEGKKVEMPKILKDSKVRQEILDYIAQQLQPIAASAVLPGDIISLNGELREVLAVVARTSAGHSVLHRGETGRTLTVLHPDQQIVRVHTL